MPDNSHLDVQIGRLDERFKALEKKVDNSTSSIISEIKDLKENLSVRLERVETGKLGAQEFIRYKTDTAIQSEDFEVRLRSLEKFTNRALGIIALINFIGLMGFVYLVNRLSN